MNNAFSPILDADPFIGGSGGVWIPRTIMSVTMDDTRDCMLAPHGSFSAISMKCLSNRSAYPEVTVRYTNGRLYKAGA